MLTTMARRFAVVVVAAALFLGLSGCSADLQTGAAAAEPMPTKPATAVATAPARVDDPAAKSVSPPQAAPATSVAEGPLHPPYTPPAADARLVIAKIGVEAPVVAVGVNGDGEVESPTDGRVVGWYNLSPAPGPRGNSILVGHVDHKGATAVFWRLRELKPGDLIEMRNGEGQTAKFAVDWVESFPINAAPLDVVFASTKEGKVTLITCEGTFDPVTRNYQHRLVVRANYVGR